jgi:hypothetical protein
MKRHFLAHGPGFETHQHAVWGYGIRIRIRQDAVLKTHVSYLNTTGQIHAGQTVY